MSNDPTGILCPECSSNKTKVIESRPRSCRGGSIYQRRGCKKCSARFNTVVVHENVYLDSKKKFIRELIEKMQGGL